MNTSQRRGSGAIQQLGCSMAPSLTGAIQPKGTISMKRLLLSAAAAAVTLTALPNIANAQPWQSIDARQANLERRIDQGVRHGDLTRPEAMRLRGEFRDLARLERQYRRDGLSPWERRDLDRRFDRLSNRIYAERHDNQDRVRRY